MRDVLGVFTGTHVRAIDDRWDTVLGAVVVLIESDDQQAIVRFCPFGIAAKMDLEPSVSNAYRSVMHIVIEVGDDKADCRQPREIAWELTEVPFGCTSVDKGFPWIVLARRAGLDIADKTLPRAVESAGERRFIERVVLVVAYALGRPAEQCEVIWLARMRDREGIDE